MNKALLSILAFIFGILLSIFFIFPNIKNNITEPKKEIVKDTSTPIQDKDQAKEEIHKEIPSFIKSDLSSYGIDTQNITKEKWETYLSKIKAEEFRSSADFYMEIALKSSSIKLLEILEEYGIKFSPKYIKTAIWYSNFKMIDYLFEKGYLSINDTYPIYDKNYDLLELLFLSRNNLKNIIIQTLIQKGMYISDPKYIVGIISSSDFRIYNHYLKTIQNNSIFTIKKYALKIAKADKKGDMVKYLIDNFDDLELKSGEFIRALSSNKSLPIEIFKEALKKDTNVNLQEDRNLYSPLRKAVNNGDIDKVKILLENGADITIKDFQDHTIYDALENSLSISANEKKQIKELLDKFNE